MSRTDSNELNDETFNAERERMKNEAQAYDSTGEVWARPSPLLEYDLPVFPVEVLPLWLKSFVEAVAASTQTPVDMAAMLSLAALSTSCANKVKVKGNGSHEEPVNIWTAIALPPASRKSAVFAQIQSVIHDYQTQLAREAQPEIAIANEQRLNKEKRLEEIRKQAAKAANVDKAVELEKEACDLAVSLAGMPLPSMPQFITNDATPESLASLMQANHGRIALTSPEGGEVFGMMNGRYSSNGQPNIDNYLKSHAGEPIDVSRQLFRRNIRYPALTIGITIQPVDLQRLMGNEYFKGRGLIARFLYSMPKSIVGHRVYEAPEIPTELTTAYRNLLTELLEIPFGNDDHSDISPHFLRLSNEAITRDREFYDWLEPQLKESGELGDITDWAGKLHGASLRIAGLLHMAKHVYETSPWEKLIDAETVSNAVKVGRYLIPHAQAAYAEMGADKTLDDARYVLAKIKSKVLKQFTKRDLLRVARRFNKASEAEPALKLLQEKNYIRQVRAPNSNSNSRLIYEGNPLFLYES
ncbi:MAG: YfjI family protein [Planctomycetota bacterium]|jgi:hypothetical protein|nr:YfjI family protein [Planctomycetota bacterium]MDP7253917.1 YfjI family protein [Planctomycetota bacterium]